MNKLKRHIKRWNRWRKREIGNGRLYHILVLLGLVVSPTFEGYLLLDELPNPKNMFHGKEMLNNEAYESAKDLCASVVTVDELMDKYFESMGCTRIKSSEEKGEK